MDDDDIAFKKKQQEDAKAMKALADKVCSPSITTTTLGLLLAKGLVEQRSLFRNST